MPLGDLPISAEPEEVGPEEAGRIATNATTATMVRPVTQKQLHRKMVEVTGRK